MRSTTSFCSIGPKPSPPVPGLTPGGSPDQAATAFRLALGREPDEIERHAAAEFFETFPPLLSPPANTSEAPPPIPPLVQYCHALLGLNEFVYLE
ncbi:MAG: hypothetical protein KY476_11465 [Planctomycetes bacterium]|nr:hypothetical protein [Planctomycetota bacterium]